MHASTFTRLATGLATGLAAVTLLSSCEPTPRTALDKKKSKENPTAQAEAEAPEAAETSKAATVTVTASTAVAVAPAPAPAKAPALVITGSRAVTAAEISAKPEVKAAIEAKIAEKKDSTPLVPLQPAEKIAPAITPIDSMINIIATHQDYNIMRPWEKLPTSQSTARGIYLGDGLVLTSGDIGTAATYIEMSLPNGAEKATARIVKHDPDRDLTLLELKDKETNKDFFATRSALVLGEALKLSDSATLWNRVRGNQGQQIAIKIERGAEAAYSSPRLIASSAQAINESEAEGLPIVKDGKLVALAMSYNTGLQQLNIVNAEVIKNFLDQTDLSKLRAPILGVQRSFVKDPVMLRYLKVDKDSPGFYISAVTHGGAADQAGLEKGDLIIEIDGQKIDSQGQIEHPLYGALDAFAFLQGVRQQGDSVPVKIARDGKIQDLSIKLNRDLLKNDLFRSTEDGVAPRYIIHGGLLFQTLANDYLNDVRGKSRGALPAEYLELEARQEELIEKGYKEFVGLTAIFPTAATLGYNSVGYCFVEKVNGKEVHTLDQLATYLDEPTENGIISIETNKPPYKIYLDRKLAEESNEKIRRVDIPQLRNL